MKCNRIRLIFMIIFFFGLGIGTYFILKESYAATDKPQAVITCKNSVYTGSKQVIATCSCGTIANASQTNIGSYKITCKGDSSHSNATAKNCPIKKKDSVTVTLKTLTYTGSGISASTKATSGSKVTVTYYSDSTCNEKTTILNAVNEGGAPKIPGTYYVLAKTQGNVVYRPTTSGCKKALTIKSEIESVSLNSQAITIEKNKIIS